VQLLYFGDNFRVLADEGIFWTLPLSTNQKISQTRVGGFEHESKVSARY
jgi:hypothetical protein